ncbi:hypothetical protein E0L93_04980 [Rubrobacter taiwanensis]|jgi:serine phosphatase RsbU (regulator of sigma subunit)|uniref:PPM-type phosphatase domain-containing protein n=1 Tax=Rubrobacter taiwanensis TaxID=185139 RepID=A0A4R1BN21_9ACTN|nr:hypothetical protein E0L93_04980 [Rubrobacter taiwanensis]
MVPHGGRSFNAPALPETPAGRIIQGQFSHADARRVLRHPETLPGGEDFLAPPPGRIPGHIARRVSETFGLPAALFVLDLDNTALHLAASHPEPGKREVLDLREHPLSRVIHDRRPAALSAAGLPGEPGPLSGAEYLAAAPVLAGDSVAGALVLGGAEPFGAETLRELARLGVRAGSALAIADRYTDELKRMRRRAELSIAAELQQEALPPNELYTERVGVAGFIEPAYDIGGDWFDYALNGDRLSVAICDAAGKALRAAAVATISLGAVRNSRRRGLSLQETMLAAHRALLESTGPEQFATLLVAEIDLRTREMRVINAGHPLPVAVGGKEPLPLRTSSIYPPLGGLEDGQTYNPDIFRLEPGLRLLFLSDGVLERRGRDRSPLGLKGLLRRAQRYANLPPFPYVQALIREVVEFGDDPLRDDATILGVELR